MLSKNTARCIAKISGDGCLSKKYIRYANTNSILRNEFLRDIKQIFGNITITKGVVNSGTPFIHITNKKTLQYFLRYLNDYKSNKIKIPTIIKQSNLNLQKEYLRAFYDDEGSVVLRVFQKTKEWKRNIRLTSVSKQMILDVSFLLNNNFKIKTNEIIHYTKKNYKKCYYLDITGKENILKFKNVIGFKHPKKIKKINLLLKTYGNTFSRNKAGFDKLYKELVTLNKLCPQKNRLP